MSASEPAAASAVAKAYVREMLDLNPMWQSAEILRRRRELWGIEAPAGVSSGTPVPAADPVAEQRLKDRARRCLEIVESQFYELPAEKLTQYLGFLTNDRLPEYNAKAAHLQRVAARRAELLAIRNGNDDQKFVFSLLNGLVAPAAQAAALREQYIESIIEEKRVMPATRMVKSVVKQYPGVYELERDWFDVLTDPKNARDWSARYSLRGRYKQFVGNGKVNLIAIGVVILVAILSAVVDPSDRRSRRRNSSPIPYRPPTQVVTPPKTSDMMSEAMKSMQRPTPTYEEAMQRAFPDNATTPTDPLSGSLSGPQTGIPGIQTPPRFDPPGFEMPSSPIARDPARNLYEPPDYSGVMDEHKKQIEEMNQSVNQMLEEQRLQMRERMLRGVPDTPRFRRPPSASDLMRPRTTVPRPAVPRPSLPRPGGTSPSSTLPGFGAPGGSN